MDEYKKPGVVKKPLLRINMAQSLNGHTIEPDGKWTLGSAEDKKRMDKLRLWADCLIASRRSIENDNPNLFARSKPGARQPVPVVVMSNLSRKISETSRIFLPPHPVGEFWVCGKTAPDIAQIVEEPRDSRASKWRVFHFQNVREIYDSLAGRNFYKILLEGGPSLNGYFFRENLIDEIFFTMVPCVWGGKNFDRIIVSPETLDIGKFRLINLERRGDEVFFRYKKIRSRQ
ncbi:MAG: RibD family protein [Spirochaetia bacterium]|nr:RibD family protein [Spirochaetia bacterium]